MPLTAGTRIGAYRVTAKIGEGGMGEVYQGRDTKLDRDVALKVLPEAFTSDPDRLARFEREAKVLASLNHPNIGSIYGLEEAEGGRFRALVLELIEGPTLADRIAQGPIPLDEAIPIARQIAEALEAAHEQGVIHRDLKPANIKVKDDGTVKVLDFGLAKAFQPEASDPNMSLSPTISLTAAATQMGMVIGTAAYMSPEQAKARAVDRRSDVWAFGAVLFEMLTGQRAFAGNDVSEVLASVLAREPDWTLLPVGLPPVLGAYTRRCLHKDPKQRIGDVQDVRLALEGAFETAAPRATESVTVVQPAWRRLLPVAAALVVGGFAVGLIGWTQWPTGEPALVTQFIHQLPDAQTLRRAGRPVLAVSPDGRSFVYNTDEGLFLRAMDEREARLIPGTGADLATPFFSPDGQHVGFFQDDQLKRIPISGGVPRPITPAPFLPYGATWASDDSILFGQREGIVRVSANGGPADVVIQAQPGERFANPQLLPDGQTVLFASGGETGESSLDIAMQSLATQTRTLLVPGGHSPRYLPTGHLVYGIDDDLFAASFAPDTQTNGQGVLLEQGVMRGVGAPSAHYAVSDTGTLVYATGGFADAGDEKGLMWGGRDGQQERLTTPNRRYLNVSLSPNGSEAALEIADAGASTVWVTELERGTLSPLTTEPGFAGRPLWSPDGVHVAYTARRDGRLELRSSAKDGTGASELLTSFDDAVLDARSASWAPDGVTLVVDVASPDTGFDIGLLPVDPVDGSPSAWQPLIQTDDDEQKPAISPDGRWIAYQANYGGNSQIYVERFPDLGDRRQVSVGSSIHFNATWSQDGNALFYIRLSPLAVMRASVSADATGAPVVGTGEVQFTHGFFNSPTTYRTWDLAPDADRILMLVAAGDGLAEEPFSGDQITIIQHWVEELKRLVPGP